MKKKYKFVNNSKQLSDIKDTTAE